jgi:hypothetical protein
MASNASKNRAPKLWLDVRFDLERKELMIGFTKSEQARAYQMKNPESRIFADESQRDVWLPILPSMKYIRSSIDGLAIFFTSADAAKRWCDRSILGHLRSQNKQEVYIQREWEEERLDERYALTRGDDYSQNPLHGDPPNPLALPQPRGADFIGTKAVHYG